MDRPEIDPKATLEEQAKTLFNVAIKDAEHLKKWLQATNRRWLIFDSSELVDSLPFPDGLDTLIQLIACYRDHRRTIPSGEIEEMKDPTLGKTVRVPLMKDENLEVAEMDRAVRYLIGKITERDASWKLENPAM